MEHVVAARSFADRMQDLLASVTCRQVRDTEFEDVCRLRYAAYRKDGSLPEQASGRFSDRYDLLPTTTTFGLFIDDGLAGSLRVHVFDREWPDSPATTAFPDIVGPWLDGGARLVDGTRFVVAEKAGRQHPFLAYLVARIAWIAGHHHDPDWIVTTCRPEHQAFYRRVFGHEVVAAPRPYPNLIKPQGLLRLDQRGRRCAVHQRYPFFRSTQEERSTLFGASGLLASPEGRPQSRPSPSPDEARELQAIGAAGR